MKPLLTHIILCGYSLSYAKLTPFAKNLDNQWIKDETYRMAWYMVRDTARVEIGTVSTQLTTNKDRLTAATSVSMKGEWVDSSLIPYDLIQLR